MINYALWNTDNASPPRTKPPTKVDLFHMRKKTCIEPTYIRIIRQTNKQSSPRSPKDRNNGIILSFISFRRPHHAPPAKRITITINVATCRTSVFKHLLLMPTANFRLASRHFGMSIHIGNKWFEPMFRYLHIRIQQNDIFRIYLI